MQKLKNISFTWQNFTLLTAGALIQAVNVNLFLAPAKIAPGGVAGIAIIVRESTGWPIGLMMFLLNIPLLIIGFRSLGRFKFLFRTLYVVVLTSTSIDVIGKWMPLHGITDDLLLNSLYAAVIGGISSGIIYRGRGTGGGTGILARFLQLKTGIPISEVYLLTDGLVVIVAGFVFGWERAMYALITIFIWGIAADRVVEGPSVVLTAHVITDQPKQVTLAVFNQLGFGITAWHAQGMFTESEHTVLFCIINRPDANIFRQVILEIDPHAFIVIGQGHQAVGGVLPRNPNTQNIEKPKKT